MTKLWPGILVFLAAATWGTLGPIGAFLNTLGFSGREVASLRIAFAALPLAAAFLFRSRGFRPYAQMVRLVIAHAAFGVIGFNIAYFTAISRIGVTLSVALLYTSPLWTVMGAAVFLGVGLGIKQMGLAALSVAGVLLVLSPNLFLGGDQSLGLDAAGIFAALLSAICYALYGVLGKRCLKRGLTPTDLVFSSFLTAGLANLLSPDLWSGLRRLAMYHSPGVLLALLGLSWFGTVMSYLLFTRGLNELPATSASLITPVEPVTAVILAAMLLHEPLSLLQVSGFCLIVGGAVAGAFLAPSKNRPRWD